MAKWSGKICFVEDEEITPGVWKPKVTERPYSGDVINNKFKIQQASNSTNGTLNVAIGISIIADSFAKENFGYMKYIQYNGSLWNITDVEPQYPRLILNVGGRYNGK